MANQILDRQQRHRLNRLRCRLWLARLRSATPCRISRRWIDTPAISHLHEQPTQTHQPAEPVPLEEQTAGIDTPDEVEEAVEEVLQEVPVIEDLVEETAADVSDLKIDEAADVVVELEAADGSIVEIPDEADEPVVLENADGTALEVELPGNADDAEVTADGAVIYEDAVVDTDIVVQAQEDGGVRMITVIDGAGAPTAFDFAVDRDGAESLVLEDDGAVGIYDGAGSLVDWVPAPWAYDAEGNEVPAWYTIDGDTLVLNVDHTAVEAYPVVADPCWSCAWKIAVCVSAIALVVASFAFGAVKVVKAVKAFRAWANVVGGYNAAASLLVRASSNSARAKIVAGIGAAMAAEILAIDTIVDKCINV